MFVGNRFYELFKEPFFGRGIMFQFAEEVRVVSRLTIKGSFGWKAEIVHGFSLIVPEE